MRRQFAQRLSHHHYQSYFVVSLLRVESGQPKSKTPIHARLGHSKQEFSNAFMAKFHYTNFPETSPRRLGEVSDKSETSPRQVGGTPWIFPTPPPCDVGVT